MKRGIKYLLLLFIALSCTLSSCHKKKDTLKNYMSGTLDAYIPLYSLVDRSYQVTTGGITNPTSGVSYQWITSYNKDTVKLSDGDPFTIFLPDSVGTFTITQIAMADGYYNTIQNLTVNTFTRYNSLKRYVAPTDSIQDPRDQQFYHIEKIGNLEWFTKNLNYTQNGEGYAKSDDIGFLFGRLYTWEEATGGISGSGLASGPQGICPDGWHIPTNEDWEDLAMALKGESMPFIDNWKGVGELLIPDTLTFNGNRVWPYSANVNRKNDAKWNAMPGGYSVNSHNNFTDIFVSAYFWSATEKDGDNAYFRYLHYDIGDFPFNYTTKNGLGASVRCVRKFN